VLLDGSGAVVRRIPASQIRQPYEAHYEQGYAGAPGFGLNRGRDGEI
jgi:hypothetical protein